jgi:hypothetical protein
VDSTTEERSKAGRVPVAAGAASGERGSVDTAAGVREDDALRALPVRGVVPSVWGVVLRGVVTRSWLVELGMQPPHDLEDDGRLLDRLILTIARRHKKRDHPSGWDRICRRPGGYVTGTMRHRAPGRVRIQVGRLSTQPIDRPTYPGCLRRKAMGKVK